VFIKICLKVGVEESIVNSPRITTMIKLFKSNLTFCLIRIFNLLVDNRPTNGAFTIDSSTPTLTGNFNEHPIVWELSCSQY
jgi:hypothetical protein